MSAKKAIKKTDIVAVLGCAIFLLVNLTAIGSSGRRRAKEAVCLSNLCQWGAAFQLYAQDNDGYFMPGWCASLYWPRRYELYWMEALRPYYGNVHKLRCCPEATIPGTAMGGGEYGGNGTFSAWGVFSGGWDYTVKGDYGSYGWNGWCGNPPPGTPSDLGQNHPIDWNWRTANVPAADTIPLMGDAQWIDAWPHHTDRAPDYEGQPWFADHVWNMLRVCINRHSGNVCWVFLDGHARTVGLKELWKIKWHRTFDLNAGPTRAEWPAWMRDFKNYPRVSQ